MKTILTISVLCVMFAGCGKTEILSDRDYAETVKDIAIDFELQGELDLAFDSYFRSAILNNARAQLFVANAYEHGRGVEQNLTLALAWYYAAALLCSDPGISPEFSSWNVMTNEQRDTASVVGFTFSEILRRSGIPNCEDYYP